MTDRCLCCRWPMGTPGSATPGSGGLCLVCETAGCSVAAIGPGVEVPEVHRRLQVSGEQRGVDVGDVLRAPRDCSEEEITRVPTGARRTARDALRDWVGLAARAPGWVKRPAREQPGARSWVVGAEPACWGPDVTVRKATRIHRHLAAVERLSDRRLLVAVLPPRYTEKSCRDLAGVVQRLLDAWPQGPDAEL